jgi:hypothetical protein
MQTHSVVPKGPHPIAWAEKAVDLGASELTLSGDQNIEIVLTKEWSMGKMTRTGNDIVPRDCASARTIPSLMPSDAPGSTSSAIL